MQKRISHHTLSVRHALNGIFWALKTQPNFQLHVLAGVFVVVFAFALHIPWVEISILVLTVFFVIICELINTALESVVDLATTEWKYHAKLAKDISAGMVLTSAIGAIIVGFLIFTPRILYLLM